MKALGPSLWFVLGALVGGLACGPALTAQPRPRAADVPAAAEESPLGLPRSMAGAAATAPLILDPADLRLGTTVQYTRVPTVTELDDLRFVRGLAHVVLTLDHWPPEYAPLEALNRVPSQADLTVVLPGYPPSRAAIQAWNLLDARARIVVVADGPPPAGVVLDLNAMRSLERLVINTDDPSLAGLERLQRPIAFRWVRD